MLLSFGIMLGSLILPYNPMAPISNVVGVVLPLVLLPAGYLSLRAGYRPDRFYIIAWSMFLLGIFITGLMFTGFMPCTLFTTYAMQFGSVMEVVLLSIALADRINILRREKVAAQHEATENLRQLNEELEIQVAQCTQELARHAGMLAQTVTERTADLRRTNEKLSQALRTKDTFLATMSHELRTPLNAVIGFSNILTGQHHGPLSERQNRYLGMIDDILDLAQIGTQDLELDLDWLSVESICQESLGLVKLAAEKKQQHISFNRDPAASGVLADEMRLQQILVILLGNAVKFTPEGGSIGLDVQISMKNECIDCTVWDTGCGISEPDLKQLFKSFVQLDGTFSRQHEGAGLGLSLVKKLTELHRGSIGVESEPGRGSRFTVHLPWSSEDRIHDEKSSPPKSHPAP